MLRIQFQFPGGRYHATPWGNHVNEGLVEWPPSPWRLCRALIATAFSKASLPDPVPADHPMRRLIAALAEQSPAYFLPAASGTHSRHYMPLGVLDKGREKTTLVLDTCAVLEDSLLVNWPVELDGECRTLLAELLEKMSYLGRAESWVEAQLHPEETPWPEMNCRLDDGSALGRGWEQVPLLAPQREANCASWFEEQSAEALKDLPLPESGKRPAAKLLKDRAKAIEAFPADLFTCLTRDTAWLQSHGWSQPPGSRKILYRRRSNCLETARPAVKARGQCLSSVEAMVLSLSSEHKRDVLPLFSRCLPQAELLHRALISRAGNGSRFKCPGILGKDQEGNRLEGHGHLHLLPLSLDFPGRLDHFLLWAKDGLNAQAQHAIESVTQLSTKGQDAPLFVRVVGKGSLAEVTALVDLRRPVLAPSRFWISQTPFVPPRFLKKNGSNSLEGQILAELASRGLPPAQITLVDKEDCAQRKFHQFVRRRRDETKAPPQDLGFGLQLEFQQPISGPISLGYGSHFGLGLFQSELENLPSPVELDL